MILAFLAAIALQSQLTLWRLLEIKFEILIQLSPAFVLGTLHERGDTSAFHTRDILAGLVLGLVVALGLYALGLRSLGGIHAGCVGVVVNYLVASTSWWWRHRRTPKPVVSIYSPDDQ